MHILPSLAYSSNNNNMDRSENAREPNNSVSSQGGREPSDSIASQASQIPDEIAQGSLNHEGLSAETGLFQDRNRFNPHGIKQMNFNVMNAENCNEHDAQEGPKESPNRKRDLNISYADIGHRSDFHHNVTRFQLKALFEKKYPELNIVMKNVHFKISEEAVTDINAIMDPDERRQALNGYLEDLKNQAMEYLNIGNNMSFLSLEANAGRSGQYELVWDKNVRNDIKISNVNSSYMFGFNANTIDDEHVVEHKDTARKLVEKIPPGPKI